MALPPVDIQFLKLNMVAYSTVKSFWGRVFLTVDEGCWEWLGWKGGSDKRAFMSLGGKQLIVARVIWEKVYGPIPAGQCVLHTCDNPVCVRPSHFFLGTRADNNKDRARKGRSACLRGDKNGNSRLTPVQVAYIREHFRSRWPSGKGNVSELARQFKVDHTTIYHIVRGKQWKS